MLTSKQRAYLRKLSQDLDATFQIGKGGITKNLTDELKNALEKNELIKISLLDTMIDQTADDKKEIADKLAKATLSNVVSVLGKRIVLYKRSSKKVKIEFPEEKEKREKEEKAKQRKLRAKTSTIRRAKENHDKAYGINTKKPDKKVDKKSDSKVSSKASNKSFSKKKETKSPIRNIKKSNKRI